MFGKKLLFLLKMKPFIYCLAFVTFGIGGVNSAKAGGLTVISTFFAFAPGAPIAWTGSSFYASTGDFGNIVEYDLNGNLLSSFASPAPNPGLNNGLAFDGTKPENNF